MDIDISKCRTELMGIAVIAVFSLHILAIADIPFWWLRKLLWIPVDWIFTEGFLFLSGFGIYHSLENDNNLVFFFRKRIRRLYFPFLITSSPFLTFITLYQGDSIGMLFCRLTTINFWIEGNFCGMWYVSVTMLLYFLAPLFYIALKGKYGYYWWIFLFLGVSFLLKLIVGGGQGLRLTHLNWLYQSPAFLIGMLTAKMEDEKTVLTSLLFICFVIIEPILSLFVKISGFSFLATIFHHLTFIVLFSLFFSYIGEVKNKYVFMGVRVVAFLGKHSLELYILHLLLYDSFRVLSINNPTINIFLAIIISLLVCCPIKILTDKLGALIFNEH